jgi:hypothetical protein
MNAVRVAAESPPPLSHLEARRLEPPRPLLPMPLISVSVFAEISSLRR